MSDPQLPHDGLSAWHADDVATPAEPSVQDIDDAPAEARPPGAGEAAGTTGLDDNVEAATEPGGNPE